MSGIRPSPALSDLLKEIDLSDDILHKVMNVYTKELKYGLSENRKSSLKCFVTYVQNLPTGDERGKFLAIDLAGVTFRVVLINLWTRMFDLRAKIYTVPSVFLVAPGEKFFDYVADCLYAFTVEHKVNRLGLPVGLSFGFPLEQKGLRTGILKFWTKGFNCSGVIGRNVVELLENSIKKREDLQVRVVAVLNDTTGMLMSCAWKDPNCRIGLILGTGTNCCYVEEVARVKKLKKDESILERPFVIINTESGGFGDGGQIEFIRTQWDRELDAETLNPGVNVCEKMISNLYLGELVRRVLVTAARKGIIFSGKVTERLMTSGSFDTRIVTEVVRDMPGQFRTARAVLNDLGYSMPWAQDCINLQFTCAATCRRAAGIVAAEMAALLNYLQEPEVTIGVDGVLFRTHPDLQDQLQKKISDLVRPGQRFRVALSEDGGGLGAALIAATASDDTAFSSTTSIDTQQSTTHRGWRRPRRSLKKDDTSKVEQAKTTAIRRTSMSDTPTPTPFPLRKSTKRSMDSETSKEVGMSRNSRLRKDKEPERASGKVLTRKERLRSSGMRAVEGVASAAPGGSEAPPRNKDMDKESENDQKDKASREADTAAAGASGSGAGTVRKSKTKDVDKEPETKAATRKATRNGNTYKDKEREPEQEPSARKPSQRSGLNPQSVVLREGEAPTAQAAITGSEVPPKSKNKDKGQPPPRERSSVCDNKSNLALGDEGTKKPEAIGSAKAEQGGRLRGNHGVPSRGRT